MSVEGEDPIKSSRGCKEDIFHGNNSGRNLFKKEYTKRFSGSYKYPCMQFS